MDKDWTELIAEMERERLEIFAIHCIGWLMCVGDGVTKTPDQIFHEVYEIGEIDCRLHPT